MSGDAASGREGLWTKPKYPGDAVRILMLHRRGELGDIRIQDYETFVKVGSFLPGVEECSPGDTPKTWPENYMTFTSSPAADAMFDNYVQAAYADGWQNYDPETYRAS